MTKAPMQRIDNILKNETYRFLMGMIRERELARIFCCHGLDHCLDVARIAYMLDMDEGAGIDRELIYAAALLHDVGRADPDNTGMEHHILSVRYAGDILRQCGFEEDETEIICDAIGSHNTDGADTDWHIFCTRRTSYLEIVSIVQPQMSVTGRILREIRE